MGTEKTHMNLKTVGIRVTPAVKENFETVAAELDSSSSSIGHTLISEFMREIAEIKEKGGRVAWPIRLRVAYVSQPEVLFGDEDGKSLPIVAEDRGGEGEERAGRAGQTAGGMKYPKPKRKRKNVEDGS